MRSSEWTHQALAPFGRCLTAEGAPSLSALDPDDLRATLARDRLLVLRGFAPPDEPQAFAALCRRWGELLRWDFGEVFEVAQRPDPQNYLFTSGDVPLHWDGAFAAQVPWLQVFHCRAAPGERGETVFVDTIGVWERADAETRARWEPVVIGYTTEKVAHYGGEIEARLIQPHPLSQAPTIRFAEGPRAETVDLNTPRLEVRRCRDGDDPQALIAELTDALYDPRHVYAHRWQAGDFVIADNHALLHGRRPYVADAPRCLWRVHVLAEMGGDLRHVPVA